ncbi:MAG: methyltransferase [Bacteroidetes bacterium]|nr:MAG: methyltransferase [Bacteroidota bacterium]REK05718.1 MAG: methyltransferase [Bacteroidota bacterium]REK31976.1 MAG: methyltransferase [Bacteroidota bacterium]REK50040.1 MAG: methyltransferase [Bacteroidota bacterium]
MKDTNNNNKPNPEKILQIGTGFWASKILLSAIHFNLFTLLAEKKKLSAAEIKSRLELNCSDRHLYDFLDSLFVLGFLSREGKMKNAQYSNGPDTNFFLDKKKPSYIGGLLEMLNNRLYGFWGNLEDGLKTGLPQNEIKDGSDHPFTAIYRSQEKLQEFMDAMSGIQTANFMALAEKFDFSKCSKLVDIGGASGMLSILIAKHHPHMKCISFDLPAVEAVAKATIHRFNLTDRVKTQSGDFFKDEIPEADVITMGNILHDWNEEKKIFLMTRAYNSLNEGGAFIAIENIIDDDRKENLFGMMMSLNMLIETGQGFDYSFEDFNRWATATGFKKTEIIRLAGPASAAIAYK